MFRFGQSRILMLLFTVMIVGIIMITFNIYKLNQMMHHFDTQPSKPRKTYAVYAKHPESGYLKHVFAVFNRMGYLKVDFNSTRDWDVLWAHDYPFIKLRSNMQTLNPNQIVNKLPGSGFVTNKVSLAKLKINSWIPRAFRIPNDTAELRRYARDNPGKLFVQKNKFHRGIKIKSVAGLNLDSASDDSFVQEYVQDPYLIDGYKFDIGVYTIITSIDPLRIYVFDGDVLLRFCSEAYLPFDASIKAKYVVQDDYRPVWKVPSLSTLSSDHGFSFKETLNYHIKTKSGRNPNIIWNQMYECIVAVYSKKEAQFSALADTYGNNKRSFFELVRFDFVLNRQLDVFLMEANMSPNLSSNHFKANRLLYEQVLYSLFRLVGLADAGHVTRQKLMTGFSSREALEMQVADKDISVFPSSCSSSVCSSFSSCRNTSAYCQLCLHCLTRDRRSVLQKAFLERMNQHGCRRIFPQNIRRNEGGDLSLFNKNLTNNNHFMLLWYQGKCQADSSWCDI